MVVRPIEMGCPYLRAPFCLSVFDCLHRQERFYEVRRDLITGPNEMYLLSIFLAVYCIPQ